MQNKDWVSVKTQIPFSPGQVIENKFANKSLNFPLSMNLCQVKWQNFWKVHWGFSFSHIWRFSPLFYALSSTVHIFRRSQELWNQIHIQGKEGLISPLELKWEVKKSTSIPNHWHEISSIKHKIPLSLLIIVSLLQLLGSVSWALLRFPFIFWMECSPDDWCSPPSLPGHTLG